MLKQFLIAAFIFTAAPLSAGAEAKLDKWQVKALKNIKADKSVLNAHWRTPESNELWVSMAPDGSGFNGYAQSFCVLLIKAGAPQGVLKTIWIFDPLTYKDGGKEMGLAACR